VIISEALRRGTRLIQSTGSDEARLEAELLLMRALRTDLVHLYGRLRDGLPVRAGGYYRRLLDRRLAHEPTPYILGHKEFFGLEFEVSRSTLIPRPETETLVELAVDFARDRYADSRFTAVDVGTGSGAIAIALARELPNARVIATEVSKRAMAVARRNAERHDVAARIDFVEGDTLLPASGRADIIAANLPYVTTEDWLATPPEIREWEPRRALDGGVDGLRFIRRLFRQAPRKLARNGALFAEIGDRQGAAARSLAEEAFPEATVDVRPDLAGRDRVICVYA
jgi:release factor glutamine methyltransferase